MKTLASISLLALMLSAFGPTGAAADVQLGVRVGQSKIVAGNNGVRARIVLGSGARAAERRRGRAGFPGRFPNRNGINRPRRTIIVYGDRDDRQNRYRDFDREPERLPPQPALPEAPVAQPITAPEPLDPLGTARLARAPGSARAGLTVGERIPQGLPHVTLDPERFDLPRPPEGEIFVRVRKQVLRITNTDRRITEIISP